MSSKTIATVGIGVACLVLAANAVRAQETATIQARANVVSALTVTGTNDLNFGNVVPGTPVTVAKEDVGAAGEFTIVGTPAAEMTLEFEMPDSLVDGLGQAMDIVFSATDVSFEDGTGGGQVAPAGVINPLIVETTRTGAGGQITLWVGGRVDPSVAQTGGAYSGTITLTVTLTGN